MEEVQKTTWHRMERRKAMRPLYLSAPPVGIALVLLAIPSLIVLTVLSLFSKKASAVLGELCGVASDINPKEEE